MDIIVVFGIGLALLFSFVNGRNDAAKSISTIVATKALTPGKAIALAATANFIGPFILTTAIATTVGTGIINPDDITPLIIVTALIAAVALVIMATRSGLPVSSSNALIGGLVGAGIAGAGVGAVILPPAETVVAVFYWSLVGAVTGAAVFGTVALLLRERPGTIGGIGALFGVSVIIPALMIAGVIQISGLFAILVFIVVSPMLGFFAALIFDVLISHLFRHARQDHMYRIFQPLQVVAGGFQAVGHGANDGQNAMGMMAALLVAGGVISGFLVPLWVILAGAAAIALGTIFGGWNVIDRIAKKITKIRPYQGFSASTSGGIILSSLTLQGIPVSSTHVISGAIVGVGATRGFKAVRWEVVREIIIAWITTIPISLISAFVLYRLMVLLT
jgi:PiT family inorganic phosphate transporter